MLEFNFFHQFSETPFKNQCANYFDGLNCTRGKREDQGKLTFLVVAHCPSAARKSGIGAAKVKGADWAKSARAHAQKMGK